MKLRMNQAIVAAMRDEMRLDPNVIVLGEDVGAAGGPFKTSEGLIEEFGPARVRDTPISEMGFLGAAVGAAAMGMRPVVEIMFMEFLGVALDALVTEAAKFRYLSAGQVSCPLVVRASVGSGLGFGAQHSQTLEGWVVGAPGLTVLQPSDSQSAYDAIRAAIRDPDPVIVFEPRSLYARRGEVALSDGPASPLERVYYRSRGTDATVVTSGQMTARVLDGLAATDLEADVLDMVSLAPWDRRAVTESVRRTQRLIVVEEGPMAAGWGAHVIASITGECFAELIAPPVRLASPDVHVPYAQRLEERYLVTREEFALQLDHLVKHGRPMSPWWERAKGDEHGD